MARRLRCVFGRHDWMKFETSDGEKAGKCRRCGKLDWHRFDPPSMSSKWRAGGGPGGAGAGTL